MLAVPPSSWPTLRALLDEALALSPGQRTRWLDALDPDHALLKAPLRELLQHAEDGGADGSAPRSRFDTLPPLAPHTDAEAGGRPLPPDAGPYRAIRLLGEGGMGTVWLAQRTDVLQQRPVALKLPRAAWRLPGLAERLAQEREILGVLDHPNIARIYDAGLAADGQPWLALEYVEGVPIDAYCRDHALGVRASVRLFLQVVRAVAYAHAQLVVHSDLKPGNVLVTGDGQARLLDFGIARLLAADGDARGIWTEAHGRALTPAYAAPEQLRGQRVGVAADVHALGVMLHELLTGALPWQPARDTAAALEDAVLRQEPTRASERTADRRRARELRGDLDTILAKALRKRPEDRYDSAGALADDLTRWLDNQPVRARPDALGYRLRKYVARHRLGLGMLATLLLTLTTGLATALWQADRARTEAAKATAIKDFLISLFEANDIDQTDAWRSRQRSVEQLLKGSVDALLGPTLSTQPAVQTELRRVVGGLLHDLEMSDDAMRLQTAQVEALGARRAPVPQQAAALKALALSQSQAGDYPASRQTLQRARALCATAGLLDGEDCLRVDVELAGLDYNERRLADAVARIDPAVTRLRRVSPHSLALSEALYTQALLKVEGGQRDAALKLLDESTDMQRTLRAGQPVRLALWRYRVARSLWRLGLLSRAEQELRDALAVARDGYGTTHPATARIALSLGRLTVYLGLRGDGPATVRNAAQVLLSPGAAVDPNDVLETRIVAANIALLQGRVDETGPLLTEALRQSDLMGEAGRIDPTLDQTRARYLLDRGRFAQARQVLHDLRDRTTTMLGTADHPSVVERSLRIADVYLAEGRPDAAQREIDGAVAALDGAGAQGPMRDRSHLLRAEWLLATARPGEADAELAPLCAAARRTPRQEQYRDVRHRLFDLCARVAAGTGQTALALTDFEEAIATMAQADRRHPYLAATRARYAALLWASARRDEAREQIALARSALETQPLGPQFERVVREAEAAMAPRGTRAGPV